MISICTFSSRNICYGRTFMHRNFLWQSVNQPTFTANCIIRSLSGKNTVKRANNSFRLTLIFGVVFAIAMFKRKNDASYIAKISDAVQLRTSKELFNSNIRFYRYCGYIFSSRVLLSNDFKSLRRFRLRESDIIVASFPKAGTTWVQEIIYMLCNDCKPSDKTSAFIETRFPYLEYPYPGIKSIEKETGQRLIKTHLPFTLLPKSFKYVKPKLIYVVRNPRDIAVSYFHFMKFIVESNFIGTFAEFVDMFMANNVPYSPLGDHVRSYCQNEMSENILVVSYEDLQKDPSKVIKDIAQFLQIDVDSNDVTKVATATSFASMKVNPSVNYQHWKEFGFAHSNGEFLRKGEVGDWKNYFDDSLLEKFKEWETKQRFPIKFEYQTTR